jgi:hypothetical protein
MSLRSFFRRLFHLREAEAARQAPKEPWKNTPVPMARRVYRDKRGAGLVEKRRVENDDDDMPAVVATTMALEAMESKEEPRNVDGPELDTGFKGGDTGGFSGGGASGSWDTPPSQPEPPVEIPSDTPVERPNYVETAPEAPVPAQEPAYTVSDYSPSSDSSSSDSSSSSSTYSGGGSDSSSSSSSD